MYSSGIHSVKYNFINQILKENIDMLYNVGRIVARKYFL